MRRAAGSIGLVVLAYALVRAFWTLNDQRWLFLYEGWADGALKFGLWVALPVVSLVVFRKMTVAGAARRLGLGGSATRGYLFGLLATSPMLIVLLAIPSRGSDPGAIVGDAILGPFAEEVLFRGVLCAGLMRLAGWRAWPAVFVSAVAFGLAHVPDFDLRLGGSFVRLVVGLGAGPLARLAADAGPWVLMVTAGGILFGWLFVRWGSLWPVAGLHSFINLWWELYDGPARPFTAAPDWMSAAHALSILLAVVLALRRPSIGSHAAGTD